MLTRAQSEPLRVVLDTNVLLSLWAFVDSRFAPLRELVERGEWIALGNEPCLAEFRRVLGYPVFRLETERQQQIYDTYAAFVRREFPSPTHRVLLPPCRDKDDQKFLELARDGQADWLVTSDKALLALARRGKLRELFRILTPDAALAETARAAEVDLIT